MSADQVRAVKYLAELDGLEPDALRVHWVVPTGQYRALDRYGRVRYYGADKVAEAALFRYWEVPADAD